jgi:hypothetical protein
MRDLALDRRVERGPKLAFAIGEGVDRCPRHKEDMKMGIATFVTAVGLTLAGTIALAQSVTYDFDRAADFSKFRTYAWTRGTELADELNHARIVRSIESQLVSKGLTRVETASNADVLVAYHTSFDRNLQINAWGSGWGGPRFGGLRSGTATTQEILTGTLVVDMMNGVTGNIVWRGIASADLDAGATPEKREKNFNKAAQKLFKNYPPKPKS